MYARIQIADPLPEFVAAGDPHAFMEAVESQPGFRGIHLLLQIGSRRGICLTLWNTESDARASSSRTEAAFGPRPFALKADDVCEVLDVASGSARPDDCTVAHLVWFGGPRSDAELAAWRRAGAERIKPTVESVPGWSATYVLFRPEDRSRTVVTFAESSEVIEAIATAIYNTELLPGEDRALLAAPDRVELYRIQGQSVPAAVA